jgi:prepilin-type N-terminal cleavage/methylation domain-containing protein
MKNYKAFTIVELLVVLAIIGVLVSLTFVGISAVQKANRDATRKIDTDNIKIKLTVYQQQFNQFPDSAHMVLNTRNGTIDLLNPLTNSTFDTVKIQQNGLSSIDYTSTYGDTIRNVPGSFCTTPSAADSWTLLYKVNPGSAKPQEFGLAPCLETGLGVNYGDKND